MENCKNEIKNKVAEIFGDKDNVILVPYSGRIRFCFPGPEKDCSFSTVDIGKLLQGKHKWTREESKLQTSYNHVIFDYVTRMKTYCISDTPISFGNTSRKALNYLELYLKGDLNHPAL